MKRILLVVSGIYLALALLGHALERTGAMTCDCREDCWCKRPGMSLLRWVFPFSHRTGC